jgi:hypothetical protein
MLVDAIGPPTDSPPTSFFVAARARGTVATRRVPAIAAADTA